MISCVRVVERQTRQLEVLVLWKGSAGSNPASDTTELSRVTAARACMRSAAACLLPVLWGGGPELAYWDRTANAAVRQRARGFDSRPLLFICSSRGSGTTLLGMPYADPAVQREYQKRWIAVRRQEWLDKHGPCIDCGIRDDLQVDHSDAKTKVSHRIWSWSAERRETELAKCVVRCGPCHRGKSLTCNENHRGEKTGTAKLTAEDVLAIRASNVKPYRLIAEQYQVDASLIGQIKRHVIWQHV